MKCTGLLCAGLLVIAAGCSGANSRVATHINQEAALTGNLPYNPLAWKVITSWIDEQNGTMSTLFGNDAAVQYARNNSGHDYPSGAVLAAVTWSQQEDPRWFGAGIPSSPKSVEFVSVIKGADQKPSWSYEKYEGSPLKESSKAEASVPGDRAAWLLAQRAAVMP
ncbi:cytochrome P460 family protein [Paracidobacterium acidisoli]|uniref:Cytochrome P460 domain-containing protein n=1 Tax=Paracidobacterium acidisoli TaxID=2303751 RepID=A0A372INS7_9BACT|nr:cytochrome P460 family protein [Paracidobacterium acidisoli]MBT9332080.1 cytochrome P460 family protein [Paracidobacterium acidisoli]